MLQPPPRTPLTPPSPTGLLKLDATMPPANQGTANTGAPPRLPVSAPPNTLPTGPHDHGGGMGHGPTAQSVQQSTPARVKEPVKQTRKLSQKPPTAQKSKGKEEKKIPEMDEASSKLVAARISQLEVDNATEREQEAEIEREVRRANRELSQQTNKMSEMEKIDHVTKRCSELFASMRRLERENMKNKKRADQLQKEKEISRAEASKQQGLKEKLEKLCRELQKENNKLKNELRQSQDGHAEFKKNTDRMHRELMQTLENLQETKDSVQLIPLSRKTEENFKTHFKSVIYDFELRELYFHSLMRTKECELQLLKVQAEAQKKAAEDEVKRSLQLNSQISNFAKTETELRGQINVYVDKFKQVEDTLNNSNDLFLTFRKEMEAMTKKTNKLEKENENLKRHKEVLSLKIASLVEERAIKALELSKFTKTEAKLKSIINQMQQQGRGLPQNSQPEAYVNGAEGDEESKYDQYDDEEDDLADGVGQAADREGDMDGEGTDDDVFELDHQPQPRGQKRPPASSGLDMSATNGRA